MPRTTAGGDDAHHQLSDDEKDLLEKQLRAEAKMLLNAGDAKLRRERDNRAKNISRRESRRAQHH